MLRKILMALASIGLLDALYLTWIKLSGEEALCAGVGDCSTVNASRYSEIAGIPIAVFGGAAYLVMLLILVYKDRVEFLRDNGAMLLVGISLAGVLYSAYLTYIELYVIHAICPYCVLSAIVLVLMLITSILYFREEWA
ncbi:MAG TPA: vitamin K epoxide reductase family protein [Anaerolineales bacterium]